MKALFALRRAALPNDKFRGSGELEVITVGTLLTSGNQFPAIEAGCLSLCQEILSELRESEVYVRNVEARKQVFQL